MKQPMLSPLPGTWVSLADQPGRFGRVNALSADTPTQVQVEWFQPPAREWVQIGRLRCGFRIGMYVRHEPRARTRRSLGEGYV